MQAFVPSYSRWVVSCTNLDVAKYIVFFKDGTGVPDG